MNARTIALGIATVTMAVAQGCGDAATSPPPISVDSVTVAPSRNTLSIGATVQLVAATWGPSGTLLTDRVITWATSDASIATVSATGLVTATGPGAATITATAEGKRGTAAIEVVAPGPIPNINGVWDWVEHIADLSNNAVCDDTGSYSFAQQGGSFVGLSEQVGACVGPSGPYRNDVRDSLRAGIVTDRGITFRVGSGSIRCDYTGAFASSSTDSVSGTVSCGTPTGTWRAVRGGAVGSVTVTPPTARLLTGGRVSFQTELRTPAGDRVFGRAVTWSTDNAAVATVSPDGVAIAVGSGTATITATAGGTSGSASLTVPPPLVMTAISAGTDQTCALAAGGDAYCWGLNGYGQLGSGNGSADYSPVPVGVVGALTWAVISAGFWHTCGLTASGAAYCWGRNDNGKLGTGSTNGSAVPVLVAGGLTFTAVSAASLHTCGLTTSGAAYCWGWNGLGQLGDGAGADRSTPVPVAGGLTFVALSAGGHHTCGIAAGGTAYCWGNNANGELGDSSGTVRPTPARVAGGISFAALSAGYYHTCGLATDGAAYCWGWNGFGQLGDGSMTGSMTPVRVAGGLTFTTLSSGFFHSCGVTTSGAAYCWGRNDVGELGDGSTTSTTTPVAVAGALTFESLSAAGYFFFDEPSDLVTDHTCGITTNRVAYCWGSNAWGFLGDGSGAQSLVPIKVAGQP